MTCGDFGMASAFTCLAVMLVRQGCGPDNIVTLGDALVMDCRRTLGLVRKARSKFGDRDDGVWEECELLDTLPDELNNAMLMVRIRFQEIGPPDGEALVLTAEFRLGGVTIGRFRVIASSYRHGNFIGARSEDQVLAACFMASCGLGE